MEGGGEGEGRKEERGNEKKWSRSFKYWGCCPLKIKWGSRGEIELRRTLVNTSLLPYKNE